MRMTLNAPQINRVVGGTLYHPPSSRVKNLDQEEILA